MKFLSLILGVVLFVGCVENIPQKQTQERYNVELYSNGELVRSWVSVGTIGRTSGVYHFEDEATGETVHVAGQQGSIVVTKR